jgi:hypothetical protein
MGTVVDVELIALREAHERHAVNALDNATMARNANCGTAAVRMS